MAARPKGGVVRVTARVTLYLTPGGDPFAPGATVEVPADEAARLVAAGFAEPPSPTASKTPDSGDGR